MEVNAVFEGGGVKGIGLVGAVACLEDRGYTFNKFAGSSAGAIVAALLSAGYRASELRDIMLDLDYRKFQDKDRLQSIPIIGKPAAFLIEKAVYSGDFTEKWIEGLLKKKGKSTFKDVMSGGRTRLKIIASDITRKKMLILPDDLGKYGYLYREFSIARAVRMSTAIPFYYKPVKLHNMGGTSYIVDGGILSLYPIWIFDNAQDSRIPTFGFKLIEPSRNHMELRRRDVISYGLDIISTMLEKDDEKYIRKRDFIRTIPIPTVGVKTTDFSITRKKRIELYNSGYKSAERFLENLERRKEILL